MPSDNFTKEQVPYGPRVGKVMGAESRIKVGEVVGHTRTGPSTGMTHSFGWRRW